MKPKASTWRQKMVQDHVNCRLAWQEGWNCYSWQAKMLNWKKQVKECQCPLWRLSLTTGIVLKTRLPPSWPMMVLAWHIHPRRFLWVNGTRRHTARNWINAHKCYDKTWQLSIVKKRPKNVEEVDVAMLRNVLEASHDAGVKAEMRRRHGRVMNIKAGC